MNNIPPRFAEMDAALGLSVLERYADRWILACEIDQHSHRTLHTRRDIIKKLFRFLRPKCYEECGVMELRAFFAYLTTGHKVPGGRWGNPYMTKPVTPRTVKDYHGHLRTLFRWIVTEGGLCASPMERIPVPTHRDDQIETFTDEQARALLAAAKRSNLPRRDEALLLFLLDTGVRASELCGLCFSDIDLTVKKATVEGKGRKSRPVYFGKATAGNGGDDVPKEKKKPAVDYAALDEGELIDRANADDPAALAMMRRRLREEPTFRQSARVLGDLEQRTIKWKLPAMLLMN